MTQKQASMEMNNVGPGEPQQSAHKENEGSLRLSYSKELLAFLFLFSILMRNVLISTLSQDK